MYSFAYYFSTTKYDFIIFLMCFKTDCNFICQVQSKAKILQAACNASTLPLYKYLTSCLSLSFLPSLSYSLCHLVLSCLSLTHSFRLTRLDCDATTDPTRLDCCLVIKSRWPKLHWPSLQGSHPTAPHDTRPTPLPHSMIDSFWSCTKDKCDLWDQMRNRNFCYYTKIHLNI